MVFLLNYCVRAVGISSPVPCAQRRLRRQDCAGQALDSAMPRLLVHTSATIGAVSACVAEVLPRGHEVGAPTAELGVVMVVAVLLGLGHVAVARRDSSVSGQRRVKGTG